MVGGAGMSALLSQFSWARSGSARTIQHSKTLAGELADGALATLKELGNKLGIPVYLGEQKYGRLTGISSHEKHTFGISGDDIKFLDNFPTPTGHYKDNIEKDIGRFSSL